MKTLNVEEKNIILLEMQKAMEVWGQFEGGIEDFNGLLRRTLNELVRLLKIGRLEISLKAPQNAIVPNGEDVTWVLYESGEASSEEPRVYYVQTPEGGQFYARVFTLIDAEYDEFTISQIDYLEKMIYSYSGRIRTRQMLGKALACDMQTGLPNRDTVMKFVAKNIMLGRIGLYNAYFLNVRNFKYINKLTDHRSGDITMIQYAQRLAALADEDEIVGRLGGDNFIALIKRTENAAFLEGIKGISVDVLTKTGLRSIMLGAVAGVYEIPDDIHNPMEIMNPISMACQMAKMVYRRDVVFYNENLAKSIMDVQTVMVNFNSALERGEFVVYLQPKIDLETGKMCGAEALARWKHGTEIIPPAKFIPPLERDGSICRLDFEILKQSCEIIQDWIKRDITPVTISVNLSRWHLEEKNTADRIIDLVKKYKFDPKYLEFEITETVDSKEYEALTKLLLRLRENGFTTSVDDFGTGYSSLTMLKDFKLDVLKLDRSFIIKLGDGEDNSRDKILISTVISLARMLDMKVLAEGVETVEQLEYLKSVNCDMVQGFYFSMPIPVEAFEEKYMCAD